MRKSAIPVAVAAAMLWTPEASSQNILQKNDWRARSFETYLPAPTHAVPWLDLDVRTRLPKRDMPIGWQASAMPPFVLHPIAPNAHASSNSASDLRRM